MNHHVTLKQGPSGIRAECSCGWGGMPRYTCEQAYGDHAMHTDLQRIKVEGETDEAAYWRILAPRH
jgi:hypothetical protein